MQLIKDIKKLDIDFLDDYSDEAIAEELKRIAKKLGKATVSKNDIEVHGKLSYSVVYKHFGTPQRYTNATDSELLKMLIGLWEMTLEKEGRTPQRKDLITYGFPISGDSYTRRFGSWKKSLVQAYKSVTSEQLNDEISIGEESRKSESKKSRTLSLRKRFFVLKRDGFTCKMCGANGLGVKLEVDHITPIAKGGSDDLDNLQTLCFECNRGKRDSIQNGT
jgi:HNH endonuclease/Homing endonuclease associated repeat